MRKLTEQDLNCVFWALKDEGTIHKYCSWEEVQEDLLNKLHLFLITSKEVVQM